MENKYDVRSSVLLNRHFKCEVYDGNHRMLKGYLGLVESLGSYRIANELVALAVSRQKSSVKRYFRNGLVITLRCC